MPKNVQDIWQYGFTEILNNAIDHSGGTQVEIHALRTDDQLTLEIRDDGEGIFKRIMNRVEHFKNVMLDFEGVDTVGRSFVDEIFRVFAGHHPGLIIMPINTNPQVHKEIARVLGPAAKGPAPAWG